MRTRAAAVEAVLLRGEFTGPEDLTDEEYDSEDVDAMRTRRIIVAVVLRCRGQVI